MLTALYQQTLKYTAAHIALLKHCCRTWTRTRTTTWTGPEPGSEPGWDQNQDQNQEQNQNLDCRLVQVEQEAVERRFLQFVHFNFKFQQVKIWLQECKQSDTRSTWTHKNPWRPNQIYRDLQRSLEIFRDLHRSTEIFRDLYRSTEIFRDL